MFPDEAQAVMRRQVYHSAFMIANNYPILPNHNEVCIQNICYSFFGPEWYNYTREEQWAKRSVIGQEYNRMLTHYLPVLQQFQLDTNNMLRFDEATLATILKKTSPANASVANASVANASVANASVANASAANAGAANASAIVHQPADSEETDDEILKTTVAKERDEAARKNLDKYYEPCQQGRKDLRIRRAKEPEGSIDMFNHNDVLLNDDGRTKNCPECGKAITKNVIKRHYQITHARDPRWVIYCPARGCDHECWRGDAKILSHIAYHHEDLHREIFGEEDVQKHVEARSKARERVKANQRVKAAAKAKATGSRSAVPDREEGQIEQTELAGDHLRGEALNHEDMDDEEVHDEGIQDEGIQDEGIQDEGIQDEGIQDEGIQDEGIYGESMHNEHMSNPNMSKPYEHHEQMSNQHNSTPYMPNPYMSSPYTPNQYVPSQPTSNQQIFNQHMLNPHTPNRYMPTQQMPTQHMSTQHMPSQHMPSQHLFNLYTPTRFMPSEEMFDEDTDDWTWSARR